MSWLPDYYDGSFKGTAFWQLDSGANTRVFAHTNAPRRLILEHPGAGVTVVNLGENAGTLALKVVTTAANMSALRGYEQSSGSLVYAGGTITAFLDTLSEPVQVAAAGDVHEATLNFLVLP